jgi:coatomer protein complex subunit epsilon
MTDVDELFELRNNFYLGNFTSAVNEANKLKLSGEKAVERDVFLFRSLIAQKQYSVVQAEISGSAPTQLQAVKCYANYMSTRQAEKSLKALDTQIQSLAPENWVSPLMSASIYLQEGRYEDALRTLQLTDNIEGKAMQVQIFVAIERVDLAKKLITKMDEDATVTQLATAWTNIALGGEKAQEAYYIFQELMDKTQSSPTLLNGAAAAHIAQGKWEEADGAVKEAAEKDPNFAETLINQVMTSTQTGAEDIARRTLATLRGSSPAHPFVSDLVQKEADMDRLILQYIPA